MIEKFNFYDIYGYLIPGLILIGLLCLPFGLLLQMWPKADITSAILVLLLAYLVGHVVQSFALWLMPSKILDGENNLRHPSELVLDSGDSTFTRVTKERIGGLVQTYFSLDVGTTEDLSSRLREATEKRDEFDENYFEERNKSRLAREEFEKQKQLLDAGQRNERKKQLKEQEKQIEQAEAPIRADENHIRALTHNRDEAFFLARSALLRDKKSSYWEQFEGLYAMMRGTSAASAIASSYFFGWILPLWCHSGAGDEAAQTVRLNGWVTGLLLFFVALTLRFSVKPKRSNRPYQKSATVASTARDRREEEQIELWAFRMCVLFVGFLSGTLIALCSAHRVHSPGGNILPVAVYGSVVMLLLALTASIIAVRSFGAYKVFAHQFAVAVWRDFANIEAKWAKPELSWSPQAQEVSLPPPPEDS